MLFRNNSVLIADRKKLGHYCCMAAGNPKKALILIAGISLTAIALAMVILFRLLNRGAGHFSSAEVRMIFGADVIIFTLLILLIRQHRKQSLTPR